MGGETKLPLCQLPFPAGQDEGGEDQLLVVFENTEWCLWVVWALGLYDQGIRSMILLVPPEDADVGSSSFYAGLGTRFGRSMLGLIFLRERRGGGRIGCGSLCSSLLRYGVF